MKIGITGATGFIGSYLITYLSRQSGLLIKGLSRGSKADMPASGPKVCWIKGDLESPTDCSTFIEDLDVVIHLAHTNTPLTSNRNLASDARLNLIPTLNLLQAIKDSERKIHLIYASSGGAVYGRVDCPRHQPLHEDEICSPVTSYGVQKLAIEAYLRIGVEEKWLVATVLRIGNPYGVLLRPERMQGLIGIAMHQLLTSKPIRIIGCLDNVRDYIHLRDVCRMIRKVIEIPKGYRVFNVSSGQGRSVKEIIGMLEEIVGHKIDIVQTMIPESEQLLVPWIVLSNERARVELDWEPEIKLIDGLRSLYSQSIDHS